MQYAGIRLLGQFNGRFYQAAFANAGLAAQQHAFCASTARDLAKYLHQVLYFLFSAQECSGQLERRRPAGGMFRGAKRVWG